MANEFVVRNGIIVSGSAYLESISQSLQTNVLGYNATTNEVFYQSTASLVPSTASFAVTASFALNVPATASTAVSASFAQSASNARSAVTASSADTFYVRGSVGVGTTSPTSQLHVQSSNPELLLYNTTTAGGTLNFVDQAWQSQITGIQGNLLFKTGGTTERMRIDGSGNVGIGSTAPTFTLDVNGAGRFNDIRLNDGRSLSSTSGGTAYVVLSPNNGNLTLNAYDNTKGINVQLGAGNIIMSVTGSNVGIGTTNPGYKLDVSGTARVTSTLIGGGRISAATEYRLNDNSYSRVAILDGAGAFAGGYNFNINSGTAQHDSTGAVAAYYYNSAGYISLFTNSSQAAGTAASERLRITSTGVVGIGTTNPLGLFEVKGDGVSYFTRGSKSLLLNPNVVGQDTNALIDTSTGMALALATAGTERMRILTGGNVGIGTTNPIYKLHVGSGDILADQVYAKVSLGIQSASGDVHVGASGDGGPATGSQDYGYYIAHNAYRASTGAWVHSRTGTIPAVRHLGSAGVSGGTSGFYWDFSDNVGTGAITWTNLMRLTTDGKLGIGTDSPAHKLTVLGAVSASSFTGSFSGTATNAVSASFAATASSADAFYVRGSVGIGTASPLSKLQVRTSTNQNFRISAGTNLEVASINDADSAYTPLTFRASIFDFQNGSVGIGITSPGSRLTVAGEGSGSVRMGNTGFGGDWVGISLSGNLNTTDYNLLSSATNTSFYLNRPSGGDMLFRHNNVDQMIIKSGGNVGIGTTSPGYKLDVNGGTGSSPFRVVSTNTTSLRTFLEATAGNVEQHFLYTGNQDWVLGLDKADSNKFKLASADDGFASAKLTVTTGGNIGIGTTNPLSPLHIGAYTPAGGYARGTVATLAGLWNSGLPTVMAIATDTTSTQDKGGSIGFGVGSEAGSTPYIYAQIKGLKELTGGTYNGYMAFYTTPAGSDANTERMRINSVGNVGIGTTNPAATLDLYQSANTTAIRMTSAGVGSKIYRLTSQLIGTSNAGFGILNDTDSRYELAINADGNVGIGTTSPGQKLEVNGNIIATPGNKIGFRYDSNDANLYGYITRAGGGGVYPLTIVGGLETGTTSVEAIRFETLTPGNARMSILNNGNVGIGITNPTSRLHVSGGNGYIDGDLTVTGAITAEELYVQYISSSIIYSTGSNKFGDATNDNQFFTGSILQSGSLATFAGSVGIGTVSPISKLNVVGSHTSGYGVVTVVSTDSAFISIDSQANDGGLRLKYNTADQWLVGIRNNDKLSFNNSSDQTKVVITQDGNVGVGITTPSTALQVVGAISASGAGYIQGNLSVGTTYNAFAANIAGTTYVIGASVWVNDGYGYVNASSGNTGFFPSGSSDIRINSAGTTRMFIASGSGNVGIGTVTPTTPLQVQGGAAMTGGWNKNTTLSATYPVLIFNSNSTKWAGIGYDHSEALRIWVNASSDDVNATTPLFNILNNGNVGVGTVTPGYKLEVNGTLGVSGNATFNGSNVSINSDNIVVGNNTTDTVGISGNTMYFPGNGNVGIGTTNPANKFVVTVDLDGSQRVALFRNTNSTGYTSIAVDRPNTARYSFVEHTTAGTTDWYVGTGYAGGGGNSSYQIGTGINTTDAKLLITTGGNVGIGTTSPTLKLQVNSPLQTEYYGTDNATPADTMNLVGTGAFRGLGTGSALLFSVPANTDGSNMWAQARILGTGDNSSNGNAEGAMFLQTRALYNPGVGGSWNWRTNMVLRASGNVGIGTTNPATKLQVVGSVALNTATDGTSRYYTYPDANHTWYYDSDIVGSSADVMTYYENFLIRHQDTTNVFLINGAGNVGIGTTSPVSPLQVNGTAQFGDLGSMTFSGAPVNIRTTETGSIAMTHTAVRTYTLGVNSSGTFNIRDFDAPADRLSITSGGNVGIGTTSPAYKLDVNVASNSDALRVQQSGASRFILNGDGVMTWGAGAASGYLSWDNNLAVVGGQTNNALALYAGAGEKVRITTGGNVGIGTTSPAAKLDIVGSNSGLALSFGTTVPNNPLFINTYGGWSGIGMDSGTAGVRIVGEYTGNSPVVDMGYYTSATVQHANWTSVMMVRQGGNVGIGNTAPNQKLELSVGNGVTGGLRINYAASATGEGMDITYLNTGATTTSFDSRYNSDSAVMRFRMKTAATAVTAMTILGSGNVGIGTTSPNDVLVVSKGTGEVRFGGTNGRTLSAYDNGSLANFDFLANQTYFDSDFLIAPGKKISTSNGSTDNLYLTTTDTSKAIYTDRNVGIGTTSPSQRLSVYGDIALANTTSIQETRIGKYQSGSLGSGTHTIASISATNVDAVFFDYVIKNSTTDLRAGTVMAVTNGSTVEYTDISTTDIGDTSKITMLADVSGGNIRLRASIDTGAGSWTIRTLLRTL